MSREAHNESAAVTLAEADALVHRLLAAREKQNELLAMVVLTVGDPPQTDSGRGALELTALIGERIDDLLAFCEGVKAEIGRYTGGF